MALSDGFETVVGTTLVTALAVAGALGAHALVGDTVVDGSPSASPSETAPVAMSDDFCTVMGDLNTYFAAKSPESDVLSGTIDFGAAEDPAVLEALHQQADATLEITSAMAGYLGHGAEVVADATVADALRTQSAFTKAQGETIAKLSREATSVEGFMSAVFAASFDPAAKPTAGEADAAGGTIADYVTTSCSIDVSAALWMDGSGDSSDASGDSSDGAKSDASTLGMEIATAFVDWKEGDPLPQVSLADGMFGVATTSTSDGGTSVSTSSFSAESSDPAIIDQSITGPLDWCVSVTDNAATPPVTYRYSATGGVEEGTCAALVD